MPTRTKDKTGSKTVRGKKATASVSRRKQKPSTRREEPFEGDTARTDEYADHMSRAARRGEEGYVNSDEREAGRLTSYALDDNFGGRKRPQRGGYASQERNDRNTHNPQTAHLNGRSRRDAWNVENDQFGYENE